MRDLNEMNHLRNRADEISFAGKTGDGGNGVFWVPSPIDRRVLYVIASDFGGWDHVSVSRKNHCPNWEEMEYVKRRFFEDDETAVQFHVPPKDHRSLHPYCLHLWRFQAQEFPRPPAEMVAP